MIISSVVASFKYVPEEQIILKPTIFRSFESDTFVHKSKIT